MLRTARLLLACALVPALASAQKSADEETPISLKQFATNTLRDQKPIWTFPAKVVRGEHWKPTLGIVLGTAALVIADPYTEPYFHDSSPFRSYKTGPLRGRNSTLAISLTPVAFYVTGLVTHQTKARNTGLLAAEALVDTQLLSFVMKNAAGRLIPDQIPPHGNYRDTWFKYRGTFTNRGSFPSGHAASAFAVATVVAERYRDRHRWLPWVAYGTATFLALTRLPDGAHFPSDIFFGAAVGYAISHYVVLRK
jgi:membrane-associated phospholipid phosphatase